MDSVQSLSDNLSVMCINNSNTHKKNDGEIKRRKVLDIGCKKLIIELSKQGLSHQAIANRLKVGRSTVTKILLNKKLVTEGALDFYDDSRKRLRKGEFDDLEIELFKWCTYGLNVDQKPKIYRGNEAKENEGLNQLIKIRNDITKEDIISYAYNLSIQMNLPNFTPNISWILKFQRKFQLDLAHVLNNNPVDINLFSKTQINSDNYSLANVVVKSNFNQNNNYYNDIKINNPPIIVPDIQIDNVATPTLNNNMPQFNTLFMNNDTSPLLLSNDQFQPMIYSHSANVSPHLSATPQFDTILGYSDPLENQHYYDSHYSDYNNNYFIDAFQPTTESHNIQPNLNQSFDQPYFPSATYDSLHQNQLGFY
ncbi:hypothetical protein K502DRAFT_325027 [Neoconidiobolus thromboides FSU 785]|nr:hypothetical protein K502DRAFT_325027 [Neoconidiobolus thromboides FSU 785]